MESTSGIVEPEEWGGTGDIAMAQSSLVLEVRSMRPSGEGYIGEHGSYCMSAGDCGWDGCGEADEVLESSWYSPNRLLLFFSLIFGGSLMFEDIILVYANNKRM